MPPLRYLAAICLAAGALSIGATAAIAQQADAPADGELPAMAPETIALAALSAELARIEARPEFSDLRTLRNQLLQRIPATQTRLEAERGALAALRTRLVSLRAELEALGSFERSELTRYQNDITFFEDELGALREALEENPDNAQVALSIDELESNLRFATAEVRRYTELLQQAEASRNDRMTELADFESLSQDRERAVEATTSRFAALRDMQSRVDDQINTLLIPESAQNKFKLWVTAAFSALVGVVILGFFVVAAIDETVRRSIFSSQSGIQFLTLFSLVIAIILFGITGILEGKELSALLGGLSGYILGRVGSDGDRQARTAA